MNRIGRSSLLSVGLAGMLLLAGLAAVRVQNRAPRPVELIPVLTGQPEYCLSCHADLPEISAAHPVRTFGCVLCHGGERLALDADLAHSTMRGGANPSDLTVVAQSCGGGNCHSGSAADGRDHIQRVMTSVQSTYAGAIANIRYTFGAQADLRARLGVYAVRDDPVTTESGVPALQAFDAAKETNPLLNTFAANCLDCHINAPPREGAVYARWTGCAACHSPLPKGALPGCCAKGSGVREVHRLTTAIPFAQCDTCHNRGNYDLRAMQFVERGDRPTDRLHAYYQPIAQFTRCEWSLDCVDCHTRTEAMGDGDLHSSKKEIQYIRCKTCHGTATALPLTRTLSDPNDIAFRLAALNPVVELNLGDTLLVTEANEPLWNTRVLPDGTYELTGKATGERFVFRPVMGSGCRQDPAQQGSQYCHECHSERR